MNRLLDFRLSRAIAMAFAFAGVIAVGGVVFGETIDPNNDNSQFAFGENAGWIDAEPNGDGADGVDVQPTKLTGWMYGENIGWINLHCDNLSSCGSVNFGVTHDGAGNLGGYAWGENAGWISFSCNNVPASCASTGNYGVTIDIPTGEFDGYAWSENEGWISFSCNNDGSCLATGNYGVQTDPATETPTGTPPPTDTPTNTPTPTDTVAPTDTPTSTSVPTDTPTSTPTPTDTPVGCPSDPDCDGFKDVLPTLHEGPANTNTTVDNCLGVANPDQLNLDGNFFDTTPPLTQNDTSRAMSDAQGDKCDDDDENDGLKDTVETGLPGPACTSATAALDPLNPDTDGDGYLDGAECALNTNPNLSASKPTADQCRILAGAATIPTDTDGDVIQDRIEVCGHNTSPSNVDSDGDGRRDGCEVGSLNTLAPVNAGDQLLLSQAITADLMGPFVYNADLNKDGANNAGDQLLLAFIITGGAC